jgi:GNAT superfamily N-acetyltransferase
VESGIFHDFIDIYKMKIRFAGLGDIGRIQVIRNLVKENRLSDPGLVPDKDVEDYMFRRGKGWVCEIDDEIIGFAIADLVDNNIWALFVHPDFEKMGAGKKLHDEMMNWYFANADKPAWLGTAPNTRAEKFYRKAGWKEIGIHGKGEIKFEMTKEDWGSLQ